MCEESQAKKSSHLSSEFRAKSPLAYFVDMDLYSSLFCSENIAYFLARALNWFKFLSKYGKVLF